jgi:hypothetical protein
LEIIAIFWRLCLNNFCDYNIKLETYHNGK